MVRDVGELVSRIYNDCYMVRHYARGGRSEIAKLRRHQAIQKLGETLRFAFNSTEEYETLIAAMLDGLRPLDVPASF